MERYFAYWYYLDGTYGEEYIIAKNKDDAIAQILYRVSRDKVKEICLFKEMRNIKW